jgi:ATP-dependent helicase/DNAse subunit B
MEMQSLLEDIRPNYQSITDFRKNNPIASKKTFKLFISFLKDADLISGETISIDDFLEVAKTQFLVKTNFNFKVTCVQKCRKI